jgi:hypothetical protein
MNRMLKVVGIVVLVMTLASVAIAGCSSKAVLKNIVAAPNKVSLVAPGTQQLAVWAVYSDGTTADVTSKSTFSGVAATVATISGGGLVTAVGNGNASINVSYSEGKVSPSASISLTVAKPTLVSIVTSPDKVNVPVGGTQNVVVTAVYSDGSTKDVTSASQLNSFDTAVVTISSGVATGAGVGTTAGVSNILVTYVESGTTLTGKIPVKVNAKVLTSIVGDSKLNVAIKGTQQLTIYAAYSDGSTANVTTKAALNSYDTAIATVDPKTGIVTGVALGTTAGVTSVFVSYVEGGVTKTTTVPLLIK